MGFFRRREETLNERLLREAGYTAEGQAAEGVEPEEDELPPPELRPPGERLPLAFDGRAAGTHPAGRWDAWGTAEDAALEGERYGFVALPDGSLVVDEDCDDAQDLSVLAAGVEREVRPPYRAEAFWESEGIWSVYASRVDVVELRGLEGDELQLTRVGGVVTFTVDDREGGEAPAALIELGARDGDDFAVEASRLVDALFEATVRTL